MASAPRLLMSANTASKAQRLPWISEITAMRGEETSAGMVHSRVRRLGRNDFAFDGAVGNQTLIGSSQCVCEMVHIKLRYVAFPVISTPRRTNKPDANVRDDVAR